MNIGRLKLRRQRNPIGDDTRRALRDAPDYWITWYTVKSLALVGMAAWVGYLYGRRR